MKRQCFVCEKRVEPYGVKDDALAPVDDATIWETNGNFGSAVFDPMDSTTLQIYICDDCLKAKQKLVLQFKRVHDVKVTPLERFKM